MSRPFQMWYVTATRRPQNPAIKWETMRAFATSNVWDGMLVYGALVGANRLRSVSLVRCGIAGNLYVSRNYLASQTDPHYWDTPEGQFEGLDCHCGTARNWHEQFPEELHQQVHPWIFEEMRHMRSVFLQSGIDPGTIAGNVPAVADGHAPEGRGAHT